MAANCATSLIEIESNWTWDDLLAWHGDTVRLVKEVAAARQGK